MKLRLKQWNVCPIAIGLCLSTSINASDILYRDCFESASERYGIDVRLLTAIAKVESNINMIAVNSNGNGTKDYGVMQINSSWKQKLSDLDIAWDDVVSSPCMNIHVGAWILANNFSTQGVNWDSIGAYNAGDKKTDAATIRRTNYATKVYRASRALMEAFAADSETEGITQIVASTGDRSKE